MEGGGRCRSGVEIEVLLTGLSRSTRLMLQLWRSWRRVLEVRVGSGARGRYGFARGEVVEGREGQT